MRIHHLNCGTCCPVGGRLFDGFSDQVSSRLVCHCLLIESDRGLILVDTGYGAQEVMTPGRRISPLFRALNRPQLRPHETAVRQVEALGFKPSDVRHILLTHLDFDHAGGIEDFPAATVHLLAAELEAAQEKRGGILGAQRYVRGQWDMVADWALYRSGQGDGWFGFEAVRDLAGLPPEILLVPLAGHTWGHSGIAVREAGGGWLLHAGDAYFYRGEIDEHPSCPPGLRAYQTMMEVDRAARLLNQRRLRELSLYHGDEVRVLCAHDAVEFDILAGAAGPAGRQATA